METLCSSGWPRTCYVHQVGLELTRSACHCLLGAGIKGSHHHSLPRTVIFKGVVSLGFVEMALELI